MFPSQTPSDRKVWFMWTLNSSQSRVLLQAPPESGTFVCLFTVAAYRSHFTSQKPVSKRCAYSFTPLLAAGRFSVLSSIPICSAICARCEEGSTFSRSLHVCSPFQHHSPGGSFLLTHKCWGSVALTFIILS